MTTPPKPTPETANVQKKTTRSKRITNQQVWEEISKLNGQIGALNNQDIIKSVSELVSKMDQHGQQDSQQKLIEEELIKIRTDLDRINTKMSTINSQVSGMRDQLTAIGDKINQFKSQPKEQTEQTGEKPAKKWWQFWKS